MASDWGEAALPDPFPLHQSGRGRGGDPFRPGFCGLIGLALKSCFLTLRA